MKTNMKKMWIVMFVLIAAAVSSPARANNDPVYVRAKVTDNPSSDPKGKYDAEYDYLYHQDNPPARFTYAPNAYEDVIHVRSNLGYIGEYRGIGVGVYGDPVDDGAKLTFIKAEGCSDDDYDNVEVKVQGRGSIESIYWVSISREGGPGPGPGPGGSALRWALVKDFIAPGTLVLRDEVTEIGVGNWEGHAPDTLYCVARADDNKGEVSFWLHDVTGTYNWVIFPAGEPENSLDGRQLTESTEPEYADSLNDIPPGEYTLKVTDAETTGQNFSRTLEFEVVQLELEAVSAYYPYEPMARLPIFSPCDGVGMGEPIYDVPESPLNVEFENIWDSEAINSMTVTYFGRTLEAVETEPGSLVFISADETLTINLAPPEESVTLGPTAVQVTDTILGVVDAAYMFLSADDTGKICFAHTPHLAIEAPVWLENDLNQISFLGDVLIETGIGTRIFENHEYTVAILDGAPQTPSVDVWRIAISEEGVIQNAIFEIEETGPDTRVFQNCDPPTFPDISPSEPESFVPFRVKITGLPGQMLAQMEGVVGLETELASIDSRDFFYASPALTTEAFVLVPPGVTSVPGGYTPLPINLTGSRMANINLGFWGCDAVRRDVKTLGSALVARSLPKWIVSLHMGGLGIRDLADCMKQLKYSVIENRTARKNWLLDNLPGKDAVVLFTHGVVPLTKVPLAHTAEFKGIETVDEMEFSLGLRGLVSKNLLGAEDLPNDLDIRFALVLACFSAWTTPTEMPPGGKTIRREWARDNNELHPAMAGFADALGDDIAYVGLSWSEAPTGAELLGVRFLNLLQGDVTVSEALQAFDVESGADEGRLKGHGNLDRKVDARHLEQGGEE